MESIKERFLFFFFDFEFSSAFYVYENTFDYEGNKKSLPKDNM